MIQSKDFLRQTELLSFCLNGASFSKADYAEMFKVTEVTINRDLTLLKKNGIQIYSRKGKVELIEKPSREILIKYASEYLPIKLNSDVFISQLRTFSKSFNNFFPLLTLLAKAVNESLYITIRYKRFYDNHILNYKIKPIQLINSGYNWVIQGFKEGEKIVKTFYVSRIERLSLHDEKFTLMDLPKSNSQKYQIVLRFNPNIEDEIFDKIWFDEFDLKKDSRGFIILSTSQEITNKLASWCISWWDMIEIIKPSKLKKFIDEMYTSFKQTNKD